MESGDIRVETEDGAFAVITAMTSSSRHSDKAVRLVREGWRVIVIYSGLTKDEEYIVKVSGTFGGKNFKETANYGFMFCNKRELGKLVGIIVPGLVTPGTKTVIKKYFPDSPKLVHIKTPKL